MVNKFEVGQMVLIGENAFGDSQERVDVALRGAVGEVGEQVDSGDPNDPGYWVYVASEDPACPSGGAYMLHSELTAIASEGDEQ